jgi:hypothetical protein
MSLEPPPSKPIIASPWTKHCQETPRIIIKQNKNFLINKSKNMLLSSYAPSAILGH